MNDEQERVNPLEPIIGVPAQPAENGDLELRPTGNLPVPRPHGPLSNARPQRVALIFVSVPSAIVGIILVVLLVIAAFFGGTRFRPTTELATTGSTTNTPTAIQATSQQTTTTKPPGEGTSLPSGSPQPSSATPSTGATSTNAATGTVIAHYASLNLPIGQGISLQAGDAPKPTTNANAMDLQYANFYTAFYTSTGTLALMTGPNPRYQDCVNDTITSTSLNPVQAHQSICYVGHNNVAIATVDSYNSLAGTSYATLDVTVWQR
jgi:hypothetical protein